MKRNPNSLCTMCKAEFYCPPSRKAKGWGKYCSKSCMGKGKAGRPDPNLTHRISTGSKPWNKGLGESISFCLRCNTPMRVWPSRPKVYCSNECRRIPDHEVKNYQTIHNRVRQLFGQDSICEKCGTTESSKFEWANLSGQYQLDRSDWMRLCCQCHRRYDFGTKNRISLP